MPTRRTALPATTVETPKARSSDTQIATSTTPAMAPIASHLAAYLQLNSQITFACFISLTSSAVQPSHWP